ncbi:MAG TPA: trigger factor [Actinomycetota bacterium]|nr:trigger factor [Actinomycetota bacterium]
MQTTVEELSENRVRLEVEVPKEDVKHAIDHAASDLAGSLKIPGFRKGKVPMQVLLARVGKERLYSEAVESHIGGWFRNAAVSTRIRPVEAPEYGYDLPDSPEHDFRFTATVAVQPKPEIADWKTLEVPRAEPDVPAELIDQELEALRETTATLVPVDGRPAREGDTVVIDLVRDGEAERDYVVELGIGRLLPEIEQGLIGMSAQETKEIQYRTQDGSQQTVSATVKDIKEKELPPLDDDLARAATEFDTLDELRAEIEARLGAQLETEMERDFRAAAVDKLVDASRVQASGPLVDQRASELLTGMARSLEQQGLSLETYLRLSGEDPANLQERLRAEAERSVARELVLEAAADKLGIDVSDEELDRIIREEASGEDEDPEEVVARIRSSPVLERLREDLRLRKTLDRIVSEVKPIPADLARAREKLWTPEQEKAPSDTKLWTPGTKEPA